MLGAHLRHQRLRAGIGLRQLAKRIGLSGAYLSRVETGAEVCPPSEAALTRWCAEIGADLPAVMALAGRVPADVASYLMHTPAAVEFVRWGKAEGWSALEWRRLAARVKAGRES
jgi:PTS system nitrogen regulatory IIA component